MKATTEKAFEAYIEETLNRNGWEECSNLLWDKKRALFPDVVVRFIKDTQVGLWTQMDKLHGSELGQKLIEALVKERAAKGTVHILRHGFKFYGKTFRMGLFQACPRSQSGNACAVPEKPPDRHPPGPLPSGGQQHHGHRPCHERPARRDHGDQEPCDRAELAGRRPPV